MIRLLTFSIVALALHLPANAQAQQDSAADYPKRPIRIVVATAPGGGVDSISRFVGEKLRLRWGQPVLVESRVGAGGTLATEFVYNSEPDGYTLVAAFPGPLAATAMFKKINYDPMQLKNIAVMAVAPMVVMARKDFPANTMRELVTYAKANPGKLSYGLSGIGSLSHLSIEMLKYRTGIDLAAVPYRGAAPAVSDLAAGQIDVMAVDLGTVLPMYEAKRVKMLAAATAQRLPQAPYVQTLLEAGLADSVLSTWYSLSAPPRTPPAILNKLNAAVLDALQSPEAKLQLQALVVEPMIADPAAVDKFVAAEAERWGAIIRGAKIVVE